MIFDRRVVLGAVMFAFGLTSFSSLSWAGPEDSKPQDTLPQVKAKLGEKQGAVLQQDQRRSHKQGHRLADLVQKERQANGGRLSEATVQKIFANKKRTKTLNREMDAHNKRYNSPNKYDALQPPTLPPINKPRGK